MIVKILDMGYTGLRKIVSGGQIGVDQGALSAAKGWPIATGGWAPKGYRTDRGPKPELKMYGLKEHSSSDYAPRTEANIKESQGTLIIASNLTSPGTNLTIELCKRHSITTYIIRLHLKDDWNTAEARMSSEGIGVANWIIENEIEVLNVAGNRGYDNRDKGTNYHMVCAHRIIDIVLKELTLRKMIIKENNDKNNDGLLDGQG